MQSRLRIGGHAVQPLLLMFPLGLFWTAFLFDLATVLGAPGLVGTLAFWNIVAGLTGGLCAGLATGFDAFATREPAVARFRFLGLLLDVGVLVLFAVLALTRVRDPDRSADPGLFAVEAAGLALAGFGTWFGGRFGPHRAPPARSRSPRPAPQN